MSDHWDAIRNDKRLDRARSKLSIDELKMIVDHVSAYWEKLYLSAVKGRRDMRSALKNERAKTK